MKKRNVKPGRTKTHRVKNRYVLFCILLGITLVGLFFFSTQGRLQKRGVLSQESQQALTPDQVYQNLIAGNKRYYTDTPRERKSLLKMSKHAAQRGQFPKAVILACMDSRSIPEIIFDQSIADIFTLRVAGNIVNDDMLASLEYATKYAGTKLIVIMGHTRCGAISAACNCVTDGNLESLICAIRPAVERVKEQNDNQIDCDDAATLKAITIQNVRNMKELVVKNSPVIRELLSSGEVGMVGALHDIKSGVVTFI